MPGGEGTGELNQSIGAIALAFAVSGCCREAGPVRREESLSAVENMDLKLWVPARAGVPGWATAFCAWLLSFDQLNSIPEGPVLQGLPISATCCCLSPKT